MLEGFKNNITANKPNPFWNMSTTANNPVQTATGTLERQQKTDSVELSKKTMSKQTKTLLTLGGIATAVIGTILAVKGYRSHQISKGLEQIEQKFLKLQENMPEVQKTFKDVFLRGDITEKEALEMLNRYKEVEKIGITGTKEEYARALFDEAKRNYGFENINLRMHYDNLRAAHIGGGYAPSFDFVSVCSTNSKERLMNIIHHEFRHVKQIFYAVNAEPDRLVQAMKEAKKGTEGEKYIPTAEQILKPFNMTKPNKNLVPKEYKTFVEDVIQGAKEQTYCGGETGEEYLTNKREIDARFAGESMAKLFGLKAI